MNSDHFPPLILASSSRFRRQQLSSLGLKFESISPDIDETVQAGESAANATLRLATAKAQEVQRRQCQAVVIGSDQLCALESGELVGKPGNIEAAQLQLTRLSGQCVRFYSAVVVAHPNGEQSRVSITEVKFRQLADEEITRYLECEPDAVYCAGSFMSEALGISLVEHIKSEDSSALIGLPLIATAKILRQLGYLVP